MTEKRNSYKTTVEVTTPNGSAQPAAIAAYLNKQLPSHLEPRAELEVKPGDILLTCAGPRIRCGVPCLVKETRPKLMMSGKMYRMRVSDSDADPRYIEAALRSSDAQEQIDSMKTGMSESGMNLTHARFAELTIPLAPVKEQKRIADKLDSLLSRVDLCRERLDRVPSILRHFRQSVLAAATSGKLTEDWREERGLTKAGWESKPLSEILLAIESGVNVKCVERPPLPSEKGLVKISAVTWGEFDDNESKTLPTASEIPESTRIQRGDFLISRANTLELVAACVIVERVTRPVYLSDKVLRLVIPDEQKLWVLYSLRSAKGREQIQTLASGNQLSMRNISQANLRSIIIVEPPSPERNEAVKRVQRLLAFADQIEQKHALAMANVKRLTPSLLAKAFRGELVLQDPSDESAAVLLERIKRTREEEWHHASRKKEFSTKRKVKS